MYEIRLHGRGGQGVVTAAELLSVAAFAEGRHAQAFPSFGSERTGAPVVAFCRIDDRPIRLREPVAEPDAVIVQDPTLLHQVDVFAGLRPDGSCCVNTGAPGRARRWATVAARAADRACSPCRPPALARDHLGRPLPNAALLGGVRRAERADVARAGRRRDPRTGSRARSREGNVGRRAGGVRAPCRAAERSHA